MIVREAILCKIVEPRVLGGVEQFEPFATGLRRRHLGEERVGLRSAVEAPGETAVHRSRGELAKLVVGTKG